MNRPLLSIIAFAWLGFSGAMHFVIDVVAQYARHHRAPGPETTLYYGLNSAYSLGQVVFAIAALLMLRSAPQERVTMLLVGLVATAGWFAVVHLSMEYWQPKVGLAVLAIAALVTRR